MDAPKSLNTSCLHVQPVKFHFVLRWSFKCSVVGAFGHKVFLWGTQIVVLALRSHIKPAGRSSGGQKTRRDNAALITRTALCVISECSVFYQLLRDREGVWQAPFLHLHSLSLVLLPLLLWSFPHSDTSLWVISGRNQLWGSLHQLQLLSWTLSCFINAKQSRSYHSINTTCWWRARPIHCTPTISSVFAQATCTFLAPALHMSLLLQSRLCCVIVAGFSSERRKEPGWKDKFVQGQIENCDSVNASQAGCFTGCLETKESIVSCGFGS